MPTSACITNLLEIAFQCKHNCSCMCGFTILIPERLQRNHSDARKAKRLAWISPVFSSSSLQSTLTLAMPGPRGQVHSQCHFRSCPLRRPHGAPPRVTHHSILGYVKSLIHINFFKELSLQSWQERSSWLSVILLNDRSKQPILDEFRVFKSFLHRLL